MRPSLEYFICIAKHNNITRAAEELHITQQSLSNYLKRLEEYYELPLFTRRPTMALTSFGQSVYDRARMIQEIHDEIDAARVYNQSRSIVKVGFSIIHIYQAMDLVDIPRFRTAHSNVILRFRHNTSEILSQMLSSGELDLYFVSHIHSPKFPTPDMKPTTDFLKKDVGKFTFKAIIHPQLIHDYYGRESDALIEKWKTGVELRELSPMPLILLKQLRNPVFTDSKANNYQIHLLADSDNVHLAMEMVAERLGFAIVPDLTNTYHSGFLQFPVCAPECMREQNIVCCTTEAALENEVVRDLWNMISIQHEV